MPSNSNGHRSGNRRSCLHGGVTSGKLPDGCFSNVFRFFFSNTVTGATSWGPANKYSSPVYDSRQVACLAFQSIRLREFLISSYRSCSSRECKELIRHAIIKRNKAGRFIFEILFFLHNIFHKILFFTFFILSIFFTNFFTKFLQSHGQR